MAERELVIRVKYEASEADQASQAFWERERHRQAAAGSGGSAGGPAGSAGRGAPGGGGSSASPPPPPPVSASGSLPGNLPPGPAGGGFDHFAAMSDPYRVRGTGPGVPIVGAATAGALAVIPPGMGATNAALPGPAGGVLATGGHPLGTWYGHGGGGALPPPAMGALPGPTSGAIVGRSGPWEVMGPGGYGGSTGGGILGGSGAIPINPRPVPPGPATPRPDAANASQGLAVMAAGLGVASEYQRGILSSEREATLYSQQMGSEAAAARTENRELAALRNMPNTAATAAQFAREADAAGISSDQWRDFQTGFQAFGGQYVGEGKKFSSEQANHLQKIVAGYAVGKKGWSGADASRLLATVMSRSKAGASNEDILGQYGQLAETMQLAPGYTGPLLGQLSEVVGESVGEGGEFNDPLGAAVLLRGESERNPRTASAYSRAVLRGLRRASGDKKLAGELGLKKGMNTFEQLEAVQHAADAAKARGEDEGQFLESHGFKEIRAFGGLRAALTYGQRGGAFDRARKEAGNRQQAAARVQAEFAEYVSGEEGRASGGAAATAAARMERGGLIDQWRRYQEHSATAVESGGEMEQGGIGAWLSHATSWAFGGRREQEVHADSVRRLQRGLESSKAGRAYLDKPYREPEWWHDEWSGGQPHAPTRREYLAKHQRGGEDRVFAEMLAELKRINQRLANEGKQIAATRPGSAAATMGPAAAVTVRQPKAGDGR